MNAAATRAGIRSLAAAAAVVAALASALVLALAPAAGAAAAPAPIRFTPESYAAFTAQLAGGQVRAITFNKVPHTVHITLKNHEHWIAVYPPTAFAALDARIGDAGIPILIEHPTAKVAPVHHKLRYIAAGVLVVLIIVIAVVLMLNRRRSQALAGEQVGSPAAAGPPPPES